MVGGQRRCVCTEQGKPLDGSPFEVEVAPSPEFQAPSAIEVVDGQSNEALDKAAITFRDRDGNTFKFAPGERVRLPGDGAYDVTVCTDADKMRGRFDELVQLLAQRTGTDASQAPLKGPWRALEKMVLRPEHTPSSELDASKLCDVLRGSLVCKSFMEILNVFESLSYPDHE